MLANAFRECQCELVVLQSASFSGSSGTPASTWAFGLSPKVSTPVEQTVENPLESPRGTRSSLVLHGRRVRRNPESAAGTGFQALSPLKRLKTGRLRGAKLGRNPFSSANEPLGPDSVTH